MKTILYHWCFCYYEMFLDGFLELCKAIIREHHAALKDLKRKYNRATTGYHAQLSLYKSILAENPELYYSELALNTLVEIQSELTEYSFTERNRQAMLELILCRIMDVFECKSGVFYLALDKNDQMAVGIKAKPSTLHLMCSIGTTNQYPSTIGLSGRSSQQTDLLSTLISSARKRSILSVPDDDNDLVCHHGLPLLYEKKLIGVMQLSGITPTQNIMFQHRKTIKLMLEGIAATLVEKTIEDRYQKGFGGWWPKQLGELLKFRPKTFEDIIKGRMIEGTYLFAHLTDYSMFLPVIGDNRTSRDRAERLVDYHQKLVEIIQRYDGELGIHHKQEGTFAIFNLLEHDENHKKKALRCAIEMKEYSEKYFKENYGIESPLTIGINSGKANATNVASIEVIELSVFGNAVNIAARAEGYGAKNNIPIVATAETLQGAEKILNYKGLGEIKVKNIEELIKMYSIESEVKSAMSEIEKKAILMIKELTQGYIKIQETIEKINHSTELLRSKAKKWREKRKQITQMNEQEREEYIKRMSYESNYQIKAINEITKMIIKETPEQELYHRVLELTADMIQFHRGALMLIKTPDKGDPDREHYFDDENRLVNAAFLNAPEEMNNDLNNYDDYEASPLIEDIKNMPTILSYVILNNKTMQKCVNIKKLPKFNKDWIIKNSPVEESIKYYDYQFKKDYSFRLLNPSFEIFYNSIEICLSYQNSPFGAMNFDTPIGRDVRDPVPEYIVESAKEMASSLVNRILYSVRQKRYTDKIKACFPEQLVKYMLYEPSRFESVLKGNQQEISVISIDLEGFSKYFEKNKDNPELVTYNLNRYNSIMDSCLASRGVYTMGHKGDGIEAIANLFSEDPEVIADNIIAALLDSDTQLESLNQELRNSGEDYQFIVNVGIRTGLDYLGNVGCHSRIKLGALNLGKVAYQMCDHAHGGSIFLDETTIRRLSKNEKDGRVVLDGFDYCALEEVNCGIDGQVFRIVDIR